MSHMVCFLRLYKNFSFIWLFDHNLCYEQFLTLWLAILIGNLTKEAGPVSMTFTIPMYNCSRLQVSKNLSNNSFIYIESWILSFVKKFPVQALLPFHKRNHYENIRNRILIFKTDFIWYSKLILEVTQKNATHYFSSRLRQFIYVKYK